MGLLYFDDTVFCEAIYRILRAHIGSSIKEIGNLDLSHTL
jgi:hypothetical protein